MNSNSFIKCTNLNTVRHYYTVFLSGSGGRKTKDLININGKEKTLQILKFILILRRQDSAICSCGR